jgi:hypothetical protein
MPRGECAAEITLAGSSSFLTTCILVASVTIGAAFKDEGKSRRANRSPIVRRFGSVRCYENVTDHRMKLSQMIADQIGIRVRPQFSSIQNIRQASIWPDKIYKSRRLNSRTDQSDF